jgi:cell division protein FtsW
VKLLKIFPFFDTSVNRWATEARVLRWLTFLWLFVGLAILFSASFPTADGMGDGFRYFKQQLIWAALALVLFNITVHFPLRLALKIGSVGLFVVLILLFATYIPGIGETSNGSTRWLALGPFLLQPSEFIKPFLVLQGANLFGRWHHKHLLSKLFWLLVFAISLLGILMQPSLSMTALSGISLWLMAMAGGIPWYQLIGTALMGSLAGVFSIATKDYQRRRLMSFLNPWADQAGDGYQLSQSLMAIGSGGTWGTGFGLSNQKMFLPFQYTDFIFSVFAEEFGLVGCVALIGMLIIFASMGFRVALMCKDAVVRLVAIGSTVFLVGQAFLNIGVASGALPTTGITFPFFSYGGSSLLSSLAIAGLLVRSAREMSAAEIISIDKFNLQERRDRLREKRRSRS